VSGFVKRREFFHCSIGSGSVAGREEIEEQTARGGEAEAGLRTSDVGWHALFPKQRRDRFEPGRRLR
jgi:hypothetical protein